MGGATTGKRSHLAQFDKKVSEADIYLQLIIDQSTKLEEKISSLEDTEEREKYKALQEHTNVSQLNVSHPFDAYKTFVSKYLANA